MGQGTVLVTGGGGFLGTWICRYLKIVGHRPLSLTRRFYPHLAQENIKQVQLNICEMNADTDLPPDIIAVIHTAALAEMWGKEEDFQFVNVEGTKNIITFCKQRNIKNLIFTSSPSVVFPNTDIKGASEDTEYAKKPLNAYARTKAEAEKFILAADNKTLNTTALRPHLIFGPGDNHLIPRLMEKAKQKRLYTIGDGENLVDVIYVENAAKAHVDILERMLLSPEDVKGKAYFIGQQGPVKLWEFIEKILAMKDLKLPNKKVSFPLAYYLGLFCEIFFPILNKEPPMTRFVACQLNYSHYFNHERAKADFGFRSEVTTDEGLKRLKDSL